MKRSALLTTLAFMMFSSAVYAASSSVTVNLISKDGVGQSVGTITIKEAGKGIILEPNLTGLPPGEHGFHLHQNPNCGPAESHGQMVAGGAAGGHYDPAGTGKHLGPDHEGHLGDLPALVVDQSGKAIQPVTAPRLTMNDVAGRSLMIHEGSDNYSDQPKPLGGGGARIACGVVR